MTDAYERIVWRGVTFNRRTVAMLQAAEARLGRPFDAIPQGSYHAGTSQSAGTHDGGGAVDVFDHDLDEVQRVLREVGFAAWHRVTIPGTWNAHVHGIAIGDEEMSSGAASQVADFLAKPARDGLASHAEDPTWHPDPPFTFTYPPEDDMPLTTDDADLLVKRLLHADLPGMDGFNVGKALRQAAHADDVEKSLKGLPDSLADKLMSEMEATDGAQLTRAKVRAAAEAAIREVLRDRDGNADGADGADGADTDKKEHQAKAPADAKD